MNSATAAALCSVYTDCVIKIICCNYDIHNYEGKHESFGLDHLEATSMFIEEVQSKCTFLLVVIAFTSVFLIFPCFKNRFFN